MNATVFSHCNFDFHRGLQKYFKLLNIITSVLFMDSRKNIISLLSMAS